MSFITPTDYTPQIKDATITAVIQGDIGILTEAEIMSIEEMSSYLSGRYDVAIIFAATGIDRNPLIKMYLVDIILYHIHSRCSNRDVPKVRVDRYNKAIEWLANVADGNLSPNLPGLEDGNGNVPPTFRLGSNDKLSHEW